MLSKAIPEQVWVGIMGSLGAVIAFLMALTLRSVRALMSKAEQIEVVAQDTNKAVNCEPPGQGLKDILRALQVTQAEHVAAQAEQLRDLADRIDGVQSTVGALAARMIVVEDKTSGAQYVGPERRTRKAAAKKTPTKRAATKVAR